MSRLLRLSAALSRVLQFAKPGEMFEKYGSHSTWVQDPEASSLRRAVTKRKIPTGAVIIGNTPHIKEVDAKGRESLRPAKASDLRDVAGYRREKHKLLIRTSQPELDKKIAGAPTEDARRLVKREHLAGIRKQLKQPPSETRREIANVRGSMAGELRTTHKIMTGIRDEAERRGIPRPIGIPGSTGGHGIDRPLMIGEHLPEVVHEARGRLNTLMNENIQRRTKRAGRLEGALRKRIATGIQSTQIHEGRTPHPQNILNAKTHAAMEPFMRQVPPDKSELANIAGYVAKPKQKISLRKIERIRTRLDDLRQRTGTQAHQTQVENSLIKSGKIFESAAPAAAAATPKSFPHLKKIGVGAVLAGAAGVTLVRSLTKKKKKQEPIQFSGGDIYTAVKTNLIGGTKLINLPKRLKQTVSLRIAAAKRDAPGFRARAQELGMRKLQVVTHRMQIERDRAASELRGLRVGAQGVRNINAKLEDATSEIERLTKKVNSRGAKIVKLRGERVSPEDAFKSGQTYGETIGGQREALKSAGARAHFDKEIARVAAEKDAAHIAAVKEIKGGQRKKIAIGTATGVTVGGVAGYETGKERKKPIRMNARIDTIELDVSSLQRVRNKLTPKRTTKIHDIATGSIEGGIGILATDPLFRRLTGEAPSIRVAFKQSLHGGPKLLGKKIAIGAGIGAAATGLIGAAVTAEERRRKNRQPITQFSTTPFRKIGKDLHEPIQFGYGDRILNDRISRTNYIAKSLLTRRVKDAMAIRKIRSMKITSMSPSNTRMAAETLVGRKAITVTAAQKRRIIESANRNNPPIQFSIQSPTNRTAVTRDRYSKKIYADDKTKAENNYVRTALGGAAASTLLRKATGLRLKPAAIVGAATGIGVQAIVRNRTAKTRDQFGDRSFAGKRIDNVPAQVGGLAVTGIVGKRLIDQVRKAKKVAKVVGLHAHGAIIAFDSIDDYLQSSIFKKTRRRPEAVQAEKLWTGAKRGSRLLSDLTGPKKLDARGRPKTPEWQKPWVRNAVGVAILAGTLKGVHGARNFVHGAAARDAARGAAPGGLAHLSEVIKSGALRRAAENKIPGVKKVSDFIGHAKAEAHVAASDPLGKIATRIERAASSGPRPIRVAPSITKTSATGAVTHIPAGSEAAKIAERRRQQALRKKIGKITREGGELSAKIPLIELAETVTDWDIRDPRGRSARVYAPGSQRRTRRPKRFYERKDNQRLIHQAELGGALVAGTLLAGGRRKIATEGTESTATAVAEKILPRQSALEKLLRETRVRRLSANLTNVLKLAA